MSPPACTRRRSPYAHVVTSTAHKTLRGPRSGFILCKSDIAQPIDKTVFPGVQGGPHMHIIAAKAVCFGEALRPEFRHYAQQIIDNAQTLAEALQSHGFRLVSGGTDNHLLLVDVGVKGISGRQAEQWLEKAHITANRNTIPYDERPPLQGSGVRLGTPALTTRGWAPRRCVPSLLSSPAPSTPAVTKLACGRQAGRYRTRLRISRPWHHRPPTRDGVLGQRSEGHPAVRPYPLPFACCC